MRRKRLRFRALMNLRLCESVKT